LSPDHFEVLRRHVAPGTALGAKLAGNGAVEVEASGATVRLSDGRELIDFGSYAVALLGHRHPAVVAAVVEQLGRMPTATRVLANPAVTELVAALVERLDGKLDRVWLGSDGADAVEVAIKLARRRTSRTRVLAAEGAFHGKTLGALAATWNGAFRTGLEPVLSHVTHLPADDADAVRREVEAGDVAALLFEPIQAEGGVRRIATPVLRRWTDDARAAGAYVISDEIQVGLRRCGPISIAVAAGLEPDAVLLGKALGGGVMPLAAMVASADLHEPLTHDPTWHTSTFGGHPLACAAGSAALRTLDELAPRAERLGERVAAGLAEVARAHGALLADVRGSGLLWGLDFVTPGVAGGVLLELAQRGVLVSPCLSARKTIRLMPPMVTSDDQLDAALAILSDSIAASADLVYER
jgi:putrescine aminotransferase